MEQDTSNTSPTTDGADAEAMAERRVRRRRTIQFVATFLLVTFGLLAGYRFAISTKLNHAYLYAVAYHTATTLRFFGESSEMERPQLYRGREDSIRARLYNEPNGESVVSAAAHENENADQPLTPWELYRYRMLRVQDDLEAARDMRKKLEIPSNLDIETVDEHLALLHEWHELLEESVSRAGSTHATQRGDPAVLEALPQFAQVLDMLENQPPDDLYALGTALQELTNELARAIQLHQRYLDQTILQLQERIINGGPSVYFVARSGLNERIADLERDLAMLTDADSDTVRETLQAELDELNAERRRRAIEEEETNEPEGRTFAFIVVPDCGAIPSMSIFVASVLAFPCLWRRRLYGLLFGIPILYAVNVGRLTCLAIIGAYDTSGEIFDFVHNYVWQGIYVIFVVVVWLLWVELFVRKNQKPTASA